MTVIQKIENRIKSNGQRLTPARRSVLEALTAHKKARTAYEIVEIVGGDTKPMTVYRALDFFTNNGIVHRIESLNAYVFCHEHHCAHKDSQFMICSTCKNVDEIHNHALDDYLNQFFSDNAFKVEKKILEVHGLCRACLM